MSPEQATGDRVIDARTDIYSLGALTYEMLTGEPPHVGSTSQAVIARVLTERPRSIRVTRPSVPEHVEAAMDHALEKLPADRWATARDFAEALSGARPIARTTNTLPGRAGLGSAGHRARARSRRGRWWRRSPAFRSGSAFARRGRPPAAASAEFESSLPEGLTLPIAGSRGVDRTVERRANARLCRAGEECVASDALLAPLG